MSDLQLWRIVVSAGDDVSNEDLRRLLDDATDAQIKRIAEIQARRARAVAEISELLEMFEDGTPDPNESGGNGAAAAG